MKIDHHKLNLPTRSAQSPLHGAICSTDIFYTVGHDNNEDRKEIFHCDWMAQGNWYTTYDEAKAKRDEEEAVAKATAPRWKSNFHVVKMEITKTLTVCE